VKVIILPLYSFDELPPDIQEDILETDAYELDMAPEELRREYCRLGAVFTAHGQRLILTEEEI